MSCDALLKGTLVAARRHQKADAEKRQMNHEDIGIPLSSEIFVGESDKILAKV